MFKDLDSKTKKVLLTLATLIPILTFVGSMFFWLDARYMHRQISNIRFIETQMLILEGQVEYYERMEEFNIDLSQQDTRRYEMKLMQLLDLNKERNKILGIGDE
jgi:hypothetical protein